VAKAKQKAAADLPAFRIAVRSVAAEQNLRGDWMRRVQFTPLPSADLQPKGENPPPPDAHLSGLFTVEAAARFQVGDEFDVILRERAK
jgi:hypothetical protein